MSATLTKEGEVRVMAEHSRGGISGDLRVEITRVHDGSVYLSFFVYDPETKEALMFWETPGPVGQGDALTICGTKKVPFARVAITVT